MNTTIKLESFDLDEAARFLRLHPDTLQRKTANGEIPGAKVGGKWIYLNTHLADWLQSQYHGHRQNQQGAAGEEDEKWRSEGKAMESGTSTQRRLTGDAYARALGLGTAPRH